MLLLLFSPSVFALSFTISQSLSNSCPSSRWCYPTISSSVVSCLQSFPASGSLPISWLFASDGQNIGASTSTSVLPMNIKSWFPLGLTSLISLQSKGLSRVFSNITVQKYQFFGTQPSLLSNSHIYTWLLKKHSFDRWTFVSKVMCLLFNTLSRFLIAFLWRSKLKVSFNFMTAVTICSDFGAQENKLGIYIVKYGSSKFSQNYLDCWQWNRTFHYIERNSHVFYLKPMARKIWSKNVVSSFAMQC